MPLCMPPSPGKALGRREENGTFSKAPAERLANTVFRPPARRVADAQLLTVEDPRPGGLRAPSLQKETTWPLGRWSAAATNRRVIALGRWCSEGPVASKSKEMAAGWSPRPSPQTLANAQLFDAFELCVVWCVVVRGVVAWCVLCGVVVRCGVVRCCVVWWCGVVVWCAVVCGVVWSGMVGRRCFRRPPAKRLASAQLLVVLGGIRRVDWQVRNYL